MCHKVMAIAIRILLSLGFAFIAIGTVAEVTNMIGGDQLLATNTPMFIALGLGALTAIVVWFITRER